MDNLICIISHEEIVQANETFLRFFGFANLEALQKKHSKVSDFFVLEEDALNNEISNEKLIEHLLRNQKKDTKIKLYDLSLTKYVEKDGIKIMVEFISDVKHVTLKEMTVLSGTIISHNPEEEIIDLMTRLAKDINIIPERTFGFDSPLDKSSQNQELRG